MSRQYGSRKRPSPPAIFADERVFPVSPQWGTGVRLQAVDSVFEQ
jgi:hypothetical protein